MALNAGKTLSFKIMGTASLAIGLLLAMGIYLLNAAQNQAMLAELEQQIRQTSKTTARAVELLMPTGDSSSITAFIRSQPPLRPGGSPSERATRISIVKPDGEIKWDTDPAHEGKKTTFEETEALLREGEFYSVTRKLLADSTCMACHDVKLGATIGYVKIRSSSLPAMKMVDEARNRLIIFGIVQILALATLIGLLLRSMIIRPLQRFVASLESGEGDLTRRLPEDGGDELADLAHAFNQFLALLDQLVSAIRLATGQVGQEASLVAQAAEEVSLGANQQAQSIERSASALEELTSTVKQNAENATEGQRLSAQSRGLAEAGAPVVSQAVKAMNEVHQSAERIEQIVAAIDAIAFQTNILALNASVEAARAGEHGRGFAIVAAEVRRLAEGTSAAAHKVKRVVGEALTKIGRALEHVTRSGETLGEILEASRHLDSTVASISLASREQSVGLDEANRAIQAVQHSTQDMADESTKLADNAQAMMALAAELELLVAKFKVSKEL